MCLLFLWNFSWLSCLIFFVVVARMGLGGFAVFSSVFLNLWELMALGNLPFSGF